MNKIKEPVVEQNTTAPEEIRFIEESGFDSMSQEDIQEFINLADEDERKRASV
jgi:hypothetical protein